MKVTYRYKTTKPEKLLAKILRNGDFKEVLQVRIDYTDTHITIETNQLEETMNAITLISDLDLVSVQTQEKSGAFESIAKSTDDKLHNFAIYLN